MSVFDEMLWEDPRVNRLQDSTELWTSICSSKLLAKSQLIHFLNKCDLLHRKLKRGILLNKYLKSYGERPNDVTSAVKCKASALIIPIFSLTLVDMREKFKEIQKRHSSIPRTSYIYPTTVTVS